jgi:hypothetical protein
MYIPVQVEASDDSHREGRTIQGGRTMGRHPRVAVPKRAMRLLSMASEG